MTSVSGSLRLWSVLLRDLLPLIPEGGPQEPGFPLQHPHFRSPLYDRREPPPARLLTPRLHNPQNQKLMTAVCYPAPRSRSQPGRFCLPRTDDTPDDRDLGVGSSRGCRCNARGRTPRPPPPVHPKTSVVSTNECVWLVGSGARAGDSLSSGRGRLPWPAHEPSVGRLNDGLLPSLPDGALASLRKLEMPPDRPGEGSGPRLFLLCGVKAEGGAVLGYVGAR